ncbi:21923_t:CDS:2, partial [Gigaspora rosea]
TIDNKTKEDIEGDEKQVPEYNIKNSKKKKEVEKSPSQRGKPTARNEKMATTKELKQNIK